MSRPRCLHCGFKCHRVHDTREREVRDLEVSGRRTVLVWMRHRFSCGNCGERFLEEHFEFDGRLTRRLAHRLVADAQVMTIRAVARRHGVSWSVINTLVRAWSGLIAEHRRSRRCSVLLVDETSMRKRHRYVTVIVNADTNKTLAMIEHRSSAALTAFLMSQPHRWRRGVKVVVTDGSRAYKASVDTCLPHARHVLDRFHVIRWFCAGLTAGPPRHPTPTRRLQTRVRSRSVPGTVRAATPRRHTHRRRPGPPRHPLRHPPEAAGRLASTPRTPRPLPQPTTTTAPSKHSTGSATSTKPANCPSSTTSSTPSSPGPTKSSPGTTPTTPATAESKEQIISSKSSDEPPTVSPTPPTSKPETLLT